MIAIIKYTKNKYSLEVQAIKPYALTNIRQLQSYIS